MREAGFGDEEIERWEKSALTTKGGSLLADDGDRDVRDVKWRKRGGQGMGLGENPTRGSRGRQSAPYDRHHHCVSTNTSTQEIQNGRETSRRRLATQGQRVGQTIPQSSWVMIWRLWAFRSDHLLLALILSLPSTIHHPIPSHPTPIIIYRDSGRLMA